MSTVVTFKHKHGARRAWLTLCAVAVLAATLSAWDNPIRRAIRDPIVTAHRVLAKSWPWDLAVCLCPSARDLTVIRGDGLRLGASLYGEAGAGRPAILLLHGNSEKGRRLPLYRVLATHLAERGSLVMTLDRAGFGESEDPFKISPGQFPNADADVTAAIDYLEGLGALGGDGIYLIGHSGGVPPVFSAGSRDARVKKLVAIGPPRRLAKLLEDRQYRDMLWDRALSYREALGHGPFPSWYTEKIWMQHKLDYSELGNYEAYFAKLGHKPLLLMDGERELEADRSYLLAYYQGIVEPKRYVTVPNADHYSNTTSIRGVNIYDRRVLSDTADTIDHFLRNDSRPLPSNARLEDATSIAKPSVIMDGVTIGRT